MRQPIRQLCGMITLLMLTAAPGHASAETGEVPWYEIEIILFEPVESPASQEKWPLIIEEPPLDRAVELLPPPDTAPPAGAPLPTPVPFQQLRSSELQLTDQVRRLTAGNHYRVLLHTAWRQPLQENTDGTPVRISTVPAAAQATAVDVTGNDAVVLNRLTDSQVTQPAVANGVDGTLNLLLTRYLHFRVHLVYTNPEIDLARQIREQDNTSPAIERFVMDESRRVKRQELHYFDHPYFGLVARVIRYEAPANGATAASQ